MIDSSTEQAAIWNRNAAHYDDPSDAMEQPDVIDPQVDFLADLAGNGSAVEFGIGTGRIARTSRSPVFRMRPASSDRAATS